MEIRKSERKKAKIKLGVQGPSGSGKTYSSLLLAYGLTNNWEKIAVIDSENNSADLYAHLGSYNVLPLKGPFTPEKYIGAIKACVEARMEVIIIDSISHEWDGVGGVLDIHSNMTGNSFTNWAIVTPRHNHFIQTILQTDCHFICTMRSKQDYVLSNKNGKMVPEKVGLKSVSREGTDYEFTLVLDLDCKNKATTSKDRTGLFYGKPEFTISSETGKTILDWCNRGVTEVDIKERISKTLSLEELIGIYHQYPEFQMSLKTDFSQRKEAFTKHGN